MPRGKSASARRPASPAAACPCSSPAYDPPGQPRARRGRAVGASPGAGPARAAAARGPHRPGSALPPHPRCRVPAPRPPLRARRLQRAHQRRQVVEQRGSDAGDATGAAVPPSARARAIQLARILGEPPRQRNSASPRGRPAPLPVRSSSWTPSSFSSAWICAVSGGWEMPSRAAARPKCPSSATARKCPRRRTKRKSIPNAYRATRPIPEWTIRPGRGKKPPGISTRPRGRPRGSLILRGRSWRVAWRD